MLPCYFKLLLILLKSYYKFHSFRAQLVLVSFLYLIIWYEFAAWSRPNGHIETNPDPKPIFGQNSLNSILAHNYTKISLLTAYVLVHNFDVISFDIDILILC